MADNEGSVDCYPRIEGPNAFMFVEEPGEELVRIEPDGKVFVRGELVETDEQRLEAFSLIVGVLVKEMSPRT